MPTEQRRRTTAVEIAADALDGHDQAVRDKLAALNRTELEATARHLADIWVVSARMIADRARIDYGVVSAMLRDMLPRQDGPDDAV